MIQINISDIQRFSVGDGPGIRTTVFLKGCNLRCPWCHNPETISRDTVTLTYPKANRSVTYGRLMTVDEIVTEVMEDADFYRESGGGVTVSGGEPLLQAEAVAELAKALQAQGVSVLLDTAGCVPWSRFEVVLPYVNTVFFDWKTSHSTVMKERIGGDLPLIKSNLARLLRADKNTHVRIPLIPDVNTSEEALDAIAADPVLCEKLFSCKGTGIFHTPLAYRFPADAVQVTPRGKNLDMTADRATLMGRVTDVLDYGRAVYARITVGNRTVTAPYDGTKGEAVSLTLDQSRLTVVDREADIIIV